MIQLDPPSDFIPKRVAHLSQPMDDWDPFADPADTAAPVPAAPAAPAAPVPAPRSTAVRTVETAPLPSLAELEELLPVKLDESPELVQAAFAGDEAKVQENGCFFVEKMQIFLVCFFDAFFS